jgi:hypothetical protein
MGLDGVSCTSCHTIANEEMGIGFSGQIVYDTLKSAFGQFINPFGMPMVNVTGFTPLFSEHVSSSEACAKCHSLITETINEDGEITENSFVEQAVYHEWLNSSYSVNETRCVDCHMPTVEEGVIVSPLPSFLAERDGFAKHELVGGNVFMLNLLKDNITDLSLNATVQQFEEVIAKTNVMLQSNALNLELLLLENENDSLLLEVVLENLSGHKLPSGYPSRKMMIEFTAYTLDGDTLFHSGGMNAEGRINGELDDAFESHYDYINQEEQVQIYEYVMGNEIGEVTTILTRAYSPLKDNRIPPLGFTTGHNAYDTVQIVGNASTDLNFNSEDEQEGSGKDFIYYHVPYTGSTLDIVINVKVHYLSVPRKWLDQLFEHDATEITDFETMYNAVNMETVIMQEEELLLSINSIDEIDLNSVLLYPNPSVNEVNIEAKNLQISSLSLFDSQGKELQVEMELNGETNKLYLPESNGKYLVRIQFSDGSFTTRTVIKM